MKQKNLTPAEAAYRKFDRCRVLAVQVLVFVFAALLVCLAIALRTAEAAPAFLTAVLGMLAVYAIVAFALCRHLSRKGRALYEAAWGDDRLPVCGGLFQALVNEFEWNRFEGLTDGRVIFAEVHGNTIELELRRCSHEFHICIDPDSLFMVMDEETDAPQERQIPLSSLSEVGQVFTAIREFVER